MRTLIILALLAVLMMAAFCYESHESIESHEFTTIGYQLKIRGRSKSTQERQREICDDYYPCDTYALRHGYAAAYKRFFGQRRGK
ncbi:hypothetical protein JD844_028199 [Phrynosoma platyrhinos]|uniref:Matrix Gla protein n=1 Tax=Phrynosoma platyrhinos TaxID=52577 RepID=A0ABQ7SHG9_PHRPL|nr:hypothetical protein JD844_028199 [Phrynosoma platyrhinos]